MKGILRELAGWLVYILIVIVISWLVIAFVGENRLPA